MLIRHMCQIASRCKAILAERRPTAEGLSLLREFRASESDGPNRAMAAVTIEHINGANPSPVPYELPGS